MCQLVNGKWHGVTLLQMLVASIIIIYYPVSTIDSERKVSGYWQRVKDFKTRTKDHLLHTNTSFD